PLASAPPRPLRSAPSCPSFATTSLAALACSVPACSAASGTASSGFFLGGRPRRLGVLGASSSAAAPDALADALPSSVAFFLARGLIRSPFPPVWPCGTRPWVSYPRRSSARDSSFLGRSTDTYVLHG